AGTMQDSCKGRPARSETRSGGYDIDPPPPSHPTWTPADPTRNRRQEASAAVPFSASHMAPAGPKLGPAALAARRDRSSHPRVPAASRIGESPGLGATP